MCASNRGSPFVGLGSGVFTVGQAALKNVSCKMAKHKKACVDNQHTFIHFAFDTFGFLATNDMEFLKKAQRVKHSNVMTLRSVDVVFKTISPVIQKRGCGTDYLHVYPLYLFKLLCLI